MRELDFSTFYDTWIVDKNFTIESDSILKDTQKYIETQINEICGKCTPCRDGIPFIGDLIVKIENGNGTIEDLAQVEDFVNNLRASKCSVGLDTGKNLEVLLKLCYESFYKMVSR